MSKYTEYQIFKAMSELVLQQINLTKDREVLDIISDLDVNIWKEKTPINVALWFDWKEVLSTTPPPSKNGKFSLTAEQGAVAMCIFLEKRYWKNDHDTLLSKVYNELQQENLFDSELWTEWLSAIEEGREFDKIWDY